MIKRNCPLLTVDCAVFNNDNSVLLIRRGKPPFMNSWALPGGYIEIGEKTREACVRELEEETHVSVRQENLSLVGIYDNPDRDPRAHTCSIVYMTNEHSSERLVAGDDAAEADWHSLDKIPPLAFDHKIILDDAIKLLLK